MQLYIGKHNLSSNPDSYLPLDRIIVNTPHLAERYLKRYNKEEYSQCVDFIARIIENLVSNKIIEVYYLGKISKDEEERLYKVGIEFDGIYVLGLYDPSEGKLIINTVVRGNLRKKGTIQLYGKFQNPLKHVTIWRVRKKVSEMSNLDIILQSIIYAVINKINRYFSNSKNNQSFGPSSYI